MKVKNSAYDVDKEDSAWEPYDDDSFDPSRVLKDKELDCYLINKHYDEQEFD